VSRFCRPASFGLVIIAQSRGVESLVPTGIHTLTWTAAGWLLWEPPEKKKVAFGVDEPNSSEPTKGLKEGVFQMWGEGCICREEEDGWREGWGKWLVCISVLCVCFLASLWIVKGGMRCTLVVCTIKSGYEWQVLFSSVQFNSHSLFSLIGARTLKMPVPYPPPSVGAYTLTPSHQPLVICHKCTDHLP